MGLSFVGRTVTAAEKTWGFVRPKSEAKKFEHKFGQVGAHPQFLEQSENLCSWKLWHLRLCPLLLSLSFAPARDTTGALRKTTNRERSRIYRCLRRYSSLKAVIGESKN
jgi:hypothetical protein